MTAYDIYDSTMDGAEIGNGGLQYVPQLSATPQIIYLDFDGELTSYDGEILSIDNVEVQNSQLSEERITNILAELNKKYAGQNVIFVAEKPAVAEYSTIYIGKTSAFDEYGNFAGLVETIDEGNLNATDNAFVMLDSTASDTEIISTISHETDHLLGTLDHGGKRINAYALTIGLRNSVTVSSGQTVGNVMIEQGGTLWILGGTATRITNNWHCYISGGRASDIIHNQGELHVYGNASANNITVNGHTLWVGGDLARTDGFVSNVTINSGGLVYIEDGKALNVRVNYGGVISVSSGASASIEFNPWSGQIANNGGKITYLVQDAKIYYGGREIGLISKYMNTNSNFIINSGYSTIIYSGGYTKDNTINSGGCMYISSGGKHKGYLQINAGYVSAYSGSIIDFTVSEHNLNNGYIIKNLSLIKGSPTYTITVSAEQEFGTYKLAQGASNLSGTLTIGNGTVNYGSITVNGEDFVYCGVIYSLDNIDGDVTLTITEMVFSSDLVQVYSSGTLVKQDTIIAGEIIASGGNDLIFIPSGGMADDATINYGGNMFISSGGIATNTTVTGGDVRVFSSGFASETKINGGDMLISSCGTANNTTITEGFTYIFFGGIANDTIVNSNGIVVINSGGMADDATINYGGNMFISSGGTAIAVKENGGCVNIEDGADVTFESNVIKGLMLNTKMTVHSNTIANDVSINSNGDMLVFSGGIANSTTVTSGWIYISSGGVANATTIDNYGGMKIYDGGVADCTSISGGSMRILSGGIANYTKVDYGMIEIYSGGTANVTILSGKMHVSSGGVANDISLDSYATIYISSGGIINGAMMDEYGANISVGNGGIANSTIIKTGNMYISSGGVINKTTLYCSQNISSGVVANDTTINSKGSMYIKTGGKANRVTVNPWGDIYISSGGIANSVTVNYNGDLRISSGGTASVVFNPWKGNVYSSGGAVVNYLERDANVYYGGISSGLVAKYDSAFDLDIRSNSIIIYNRGIVDKSVINASGYMYISSGGTATNISVSSGGIYVSSGGIANSVTVNNDGFLRISSGGTASVVFNPWMGNVYSSGGAVVNYLERDANVYYGGVSSGLIARYNSVSNLAVTCNSVIIYNTGEVNETAINANALMFIFSGGVATNTTVDSSGSVNISSKGVHRGTLQIASGATVTASSGSIIDFSVSNRTAADKYLINNISLIKGAPTYTITVSAEQEFGTYKLAQGASDFTDTLTIGDGTVDYGSITVNGEDFVYNDTVYSLDQLDGNLTLTIKAPDITPPELTITGNATTPTNQDVALKISANENCTILYNIDNGEWQTYSGGITVTANGTVNIKATDEAGNVTEKSVVVDMIDKIAPTLEISGNVETPTNQDVILTANVSDGIVEYWDGAEWITGNTITATTNGTYQFRVTDAAGNVTEKSVVVDQIDKVAPTLEISGNAIEPTNKDVVLTATASDGVVEYFANGKWNSGNSLTVAENGTYQFRVTDAAGNITEKSVVVDMIDKVAPTKPEVFASTTVPTNKNVTVSAEFSLDSIKQQFSYDNQTWYDYESGIVLSRNGVLYFRGIDAVGNISEVARYAVTNIDKIAPSAPVASADITSLTNKPVTVSATFSDDAAKQQYSFDGLVWDSYTSAIVMANNGTVYFRAVDDAGNISDTTEYVVENIDRIAPAKPMAYADITGETTGAVTVSAIFSNDSVITEFSLDNKTWQTYTDGVVMESNGTVYFRGIDAAGNVSQVAVYEVNNIIAAPDVIDGDLDGNGLADVILRHTKQGFTGAWLTTGDKSVIKWGNLSDIKDDVRLLGTGKLYGTENDGQDIFFADGKSVGAWKVVDGKVTGYKNIMAVNTTTNVLGLGDFNGDGAADILLRSTSGDLGYFGTNGTGWHYLKGLGKEWSVAAVGDLNGDGLDDVVLRHDAGFAGTFLTQANNTVKWANLDTLADDMTIVGTGDFNGDGVDDVLLQNKSNGWVGAWLVEDGSVDGFMGICKNTNSIEQIADFNGDGIDDLRIRTASGDIGVLYVNGADDTTWKYFQSVGSEWETKFSALA